jgi:DNA repair exonuclease SbcCD ATPase subunit
MASPFDESEFVDTDYQASQAAGPSSTPGKPTRPPTPEEINAKVSAAQQKLAELRAAQEDLEREKSALEEIRRRRMEFRQGREEMIQHLIRGVGLLEETERTAAHELQQMGRTLAALREASDKVQALDEESWTTDNLHLELAQGLTTIENARLEWNSARLKWPVLNKAVETEEDSGDTPTVNTPLFGQQSFGQLCRIGFALNWPSAVLALVILAWLLLNR